MHRRYKFEARTRCKAESTFSYSLRNKKISDPNEAAAWFPSDSSQLPPTDHGILICNVIPVCPLLVSSRTIIDRPGNKSLSLAGHAAQLSPLLQAAWTESFQNSLEDGKTGPGGRAATSRARRSARRSSRAGRTGKHPRARHEHPSTEQPSIRENRAISH